MQKSAFNKQDAVSTPIRIAVPSVICSTSKSRVLPFSSCLPPFIPRKRQKIYFLFVQSTATRRDV